ncbi:hypothetical protein ACS764_03270 [Yersinia enterocolitica]|uniref:hypothetical protein n=1 Tax=Yersinia enterocolitica TaxID=630 RepID=UPI002AC61426|nr:hypothetical protein [Yersinia enterocolitica]HDL7853111.1 hypothetical protein [Yersinia enterocolitica]HEN3253332.1 hypothetical protein [Yersinia enterocolitica]
MDPRKLFYDERSKNWCIYCGGEAQTVDHLPSKIFLQKPYPNNLHGVDACRSCNNAFSQDEEYVACFLHCVISGTTKPESLTDERVARALIRNQKLREAIEGSHKDINGNAVWYPDIDRVKHIVLKIALGHIYYELAEVMQEEPDIFEIFPLGLIGENERIEFETRASCVISSWPEIGSREYLRITGEIIDENLRDGWFIIQDNIYRFSIEYYPRVEIKIVFNEYLGCHLVW